MYHKDTDTPALVRTMALNEELGQVSHVFCDKTGTLTENVMEFRKCSVGGVSYGKGVTDIGRAVMQRRGEKVPEEDLEAERIISKTPKVPHVRFYDPSMFADLAGAQGKATHQTLMGEFLLCLALCHTVIPEHASAEEEWEEWEEEEGRAGVGGGGGKGNREGREDGEPALSASSPDDEALVLGARHFGVEFRDRVDNYACVRRSGPLLHAAWELQETPGGGVNDNKIGGMEGWGWGGGCSSAYPRPAGGRTGGFVDEKYQVLKILDFTSQRKRMSVVVREPSGNLRIYCKGADSVMLPRLAAPARPAVAVYGHQVGRGIRAGGGSHQGCSCPGRVCSRAPCSKKTFPGCKKKTMISCSSLLNCWVLVVSLAGVRVRVRVRVSSILPAARRLNSSLQSPSLLLLPDQQQQKTLEDMEGFALEGLRTLLVACADLSWEAYSRWEVSFDAASSDMAEIEKRKEGGLNAIDALMDELEVGMRLLGCTAIEDKLQNGAGSCVADLQQAGIGVWMLTGDKEETAVNIGVACRLLRPESEADRVVINMDLRTGYRNMEEIRDRLEEEHLRHEVLYNKKNTMMVPSDDRDRVSPNAWAQGRPPRERSLVIDGQSLILATHPGCRKELATFAMECSSVLCCRVSPDQKRELVALVREYKPGARTLAIGDGANDVAMIQGAHIGVGISGQEGMQVQFRTRTRDHQMCFILKRCFCLAVNASDFAIAQFSFLRKLTLVHGRRNYRRMAKLVCYTFYKNILMAVPMAWYAIVNGCSGQKFYTEGGIQLFNLLFTSLPILLLATLDYDVSKEDCVRYPRLYILGIRDIFFNQRASTLYCVFWSWIAQATIEAAAIVMVPLLLFRGGPDDLGVEVSLFLYGATTFTLVVLLANMKVLWLQYRWTWVNVVLVLLSAASWVGVACLISAIMLVDYDFYQARLLWRLFIYFQLLVNPNFYAVMGLCLTAVFMRDLTWKFFHRWWRPKLHHLILEADVAGIGQIDVDLPDVTADKHSGDPGGRPSSLHRVVKKDLSLETGLEEDGGVGDPGSSSPSKFIPPLKWVPPLKGVDSPLFSGVSSPRWSPELSGSVIWDAMGPGNTSKSAKVIPRSRMSAMDFAASEHSGVDWRKVKQVPAGEDIELAPPPPPLTRAVSGSAISGARSQQARWRSKRPLYSPPASARQFCSYSTDDVSAGLERNVIQNYAVSPLKNARANWVTDTLDRLGQSRQCGQLPATCSKDLLGDRPVSFPAIAHRRTGSRPAGHHSHIHQEDIV
ncbi:unnamed protein product [Discosporangium mesarthrocarpum]